jgi:hypothetical protein
MVSLRIGRAKSGESAMSRGLLDHIEQASHIAAGMDIPFGEAMDMVRAAYEYASTRAEQEYRDAIAEIESIRVEGNVIYGAPFGTAKEPTSYERSL